MGANSLCVEEMQIVCCIIASYSEVYNAYKEQWVELCRRVKNAGFPVSFYFIYNGVPEFREQVHEFHTDMYFPFRETLKPGILQKTVAFYKHILDKDAGFTHMIRTNLSSFYRFDKLIEEVAALPEKNAVLAHYINGYPSGCGAVFTRDIIEYIAQYEIDYMVPQFDDAVLGYIVGKCKPTGKVYTYVNLCNNTAEGAALLMDIPHFHYRTKYTNDNPGMLGVEHFRKLLQKYY
jgi:hypothetical protein